MNVVYIITQSTFILGKAFGYIDWSWLLVFTPTFVIIGLTLALFALTFYCGVKTKHRF